MAAVEVGAVVGGKYRVERKLGEGGIGVVFAALHLELDQQVALKFLKPEAMDDADVIARFSQEARAAVRLKTEHVTRVMDVGTHEGAPFIVMEYLHGKDLEQVVAEHGPLPLADVAEYMIQACEALAEAHTRGIVHRDVKPENFFLVDEGEWKRLKMLDFGISKVALAGRVSDVDLASRRTQTIMGSPFYMSPEQLRSTRDVDYRADLWSMGATMFEIYTGRTAFPEDRTFTELVVDIVGTRHRSPREFRTDVPPEFEAILDRCLEKDRENRFQSAAELAVALLPFAPRRSRAVAERAISLSRSSADFPIVALPSSLPPPSASGLPPSRTSIGLGETRLSMSTVPAPPEKPEEPKRRSLVPIAIAIALLLSLLGAGVVFLRRDPPKDPAPIAASTGAEPKPATTAAPSEAASAIPQALASSATPTAPESPSSAQALPGSRGAPRAAGRPNPLGAKEPAPSAPPSKPNQDLDIRLER